MIVSQVWHICYVDDCTGMSRREEPEKERRMKKTGPKGP